MSRSASNNRWGIASRVLAALVGGYAVAYAVTAFLAVYLPLARPDRVVFSSLASFAVWAAVVIYVFAARSAGLFSIATATQSSAVRDSGSAGWKFSGSAFSALTVWPVISASAW